MFFVGQWHAIVEEGGMPQQKRRKNIELSSPVSFTMSTTSLLYSADLHLMEVRKVGMEKCFNLTITPSNMHYLHQQAERTTCTLLDSAFLFVEVDGKNCVEAYALSYSAEDPSILQDGGTPASQASTATPSCSSGRKMHKVPSTLELGQYARMLKLPDSTAAFEKFRSSPLLLAVDDDRDGHPNEKVVPIYCTIASYEASFENARMGQMVLKGACNFESQGFAIPIQACSMNDLLEVHMKELRIYSIYAQHNSKLFLQDHKGNLHSFFEWKLVGD